jgi:hypothetical protein
MVFKPNSSLENLMKYTCVKLKHKYYCIFKGIIKKKIYFFFGKIYLTHI